MGEKSQAKGRLGPGRPASGDREPVGITAAELAIDVLEALASSPSSLNLTELGRRTGMAPSKLHRYLVSLIRRGMVAQNAATGLYDLGAAALALAASALTRFDGFDLVYERVKSLSTTTGLSTFVYVWTGSGPVLIRSHTASTSAITLRIGSTVPILGSASGPVFAAYVPFESVEPILAHEAVSRREEPDDCRARLRNDILPMIRQQRFYWSDESILPRAAACAAPVFDIQGELFCVIGVGVPEDHDRARGREAIMATVRDAAVEISVQLGFDEKHRSPDQRSDE